MHMQTVGLQGSPLTEQPLLLVGTLPLLLADEHKRLLTLSCVSVRSWPDLGWRHLFELQARQRPEQLAMISAGQPLTCQLVNGLGNRLALVLRCRNVGPNVLVAICMICSLPRILGMLGILKAGRACLPLDPTTPPRSG
jgi:non-ribosomal peptide synthetase component F